MFSTLQVRVDDKLKSKSDSLLKFPFKTGEKSTANSPYTSMSEDKILKKLDESKKHADQGQCRRADDIVVDIRTKYGL